jgi:hypothetical protein
VVLLLNLCVFSSKEMRLQQQMPVPWRGPPALDNQPVEPAERARLTRFCSCALPRCCARALAMFPVMPLAVYSWVLLSLSIQLTNYLSKSASPLRGSHAGHTGSPGAAELPRCALHCAPLHAARRRVRSRAPRFLVILYDSIASFLGFSLFVVPTAYSTQIRPSRFTPGRKMRRGPLRLASCDQATAESGAPLVGRGASEKPPPRKPIRHSPSGLLRPAKTDFCVFGLCVCVCVCVLFL